jgi:purine catabolism regulator
VLGDVLTVLGAISAVGTSAVVYSVPHVPDAAREARWALRTAESRGGGHVDYASAHPLFLPRTVTEAQNAATTVLGAVIDYDLVHGTELVLSLQVYLNCDRSWRKAAEELGVHRQTLGSRLGKIEGLTGRDLSRTSDIAECWMALCALCTVDHARQLLARNRSDD